MRNYVIERVTGEWGGAPAWQFYRSCATLGDAKKLVELLRQRFGSTPWRIVLVDDGDRTVLT